MTASGNLVQYVPPPLHFICQYASQGQFLGNPCLDLLHLQYTPPFLQRLPVLREEVEECRASGDIAGHGRQSGELIRLRERVVHDISLEGHVKDSGTDITSGGLYENKNKECFMKSTLR